MVPTIERIKAQIDHAHFANFPEPNFLHIELHRVLGILLISPDAETVIRLIAPVRRSGNIVRSRYGIRLIIPASKFHGMSDHPDLDLISSSKPAQFTEAFGNVFGF